MAGPENFAICLDVDDLVEAHRIARAVRPWFGVAKVGLELYSAAGPDAVTELRDEGFAVFADLKFHDIPTTVGRAARVVGALGATYLNVHAAGGEAMVLAGVEGFLAGADAGGHPAPCLLAVTVLTSASDAPDEVLQEWAAMAAAAGCGGVVCSALDIATIRSVAPNLGAVTPGIRAAGADRHDQQRAATPEEALALGADVLVVGRAVTSAPDPAAAAEALIGPLITGAPGRATGVPG